MIELKQVNNDFFINGIKNNNLYDFNFNGAYKQKSYSIIIKDNKVIKTWLFYGSLKNKDKIKYNLK